MKKDKTKIYCDTCIYIDFIKDRKTDSGRPVGEEATALFTEVLKGKYELVVSYLQLEKKIEGNITYIKYTAIDKQKAIELKPNNWKDALHVVLAEKTGCRYLVTQNIKDFVEIQTPVEIILPSRFFS